MATLADMKEQVGTDVSFDLVDFSKVLVLPRCGWQHVACSQTTDLTVPSAHRLLRGLKSHSQAPALHAQVTSFRVKNETLLSDFREQLAAELGVPRKQQRLWFWEQRANSTLRPMSPVPPHADDQPVKLVRPGPATAKPKQPSNELLLWLGGMCLGLWRAVQPRLCMLARLLSGKWSKNNQTYPSDDVLQMMWRRATRR